MYASAFGLQHAPFSIAPDPRYLFMSERHREALAHLLYGLRAGGGFVLLTGEIGTGKTTICRAFLEQMPDDCDVAYVFNPKQSALELLRTINDEFGVSHTAAGPVETVKDCIDPLNAFLLASHAAGRHAVLVVDEAQNLSADVLEQLRLLTNLETSERKLLQIVLIGQPELRTLLAQPSLEQLAQRVVARFHLDALSPQETEAYVGHRLAVAGWNGPPPFDRQALRRIRALTGGVPRRINLLCDRALLGAYAAGVRQVDRRMIDSAAREVFDRQPAGRAGRAGRGLAPWLLAVALLAAAGAVVWQNRPHPAVATVSRPPAARPAQAPAAGTAAPSGGGVASGVAPATDLADILPRLPGTEDAALRLLASAWGVQVPEGAAVCATTARQALPCFRARGAGLDLLRQLDRPAVLVLNVAGRPAFAVLRRLDATSATLEVGGQPRRVAIGALAVGWRGDLVTFWRDPDTTAEATDARLARVLPGLPDGLSRSERIVRFQVAQGLPPDGLAGPLTAMRLNRASGLDEPHLLHP
ncbi:AAA family ATPase [Xylophilus sp. Kf1]|nr:AAA family ATPase [Xylophilus sp. Kf1]